jgi:hypothetical protein
VESITKEFRDLKERQVSDEELRRAKDHLKGSLMLRLGLESTGSRMSNLARQEMYFGKFFPLDELLESIEVVTADDVRRIAQAFFHPKQIALTILGNLEKFKIGREDLGVLRSREHPLCSIISITCARLKQAPEGGDSRHPPQTTPGRHKNTGT